mgnify:FL=1
MSIIDLALIGKLKKTKADKTNVLQKDNTGVYTPVTDYHPSTKKYVDDNKLKSIVDTSLIALYDGHDFAVANDLSSIIGASTTMITKNYERSLFLQDQSLILNSTSNFSLPITIEAWVYYNDNNPSNTTIFELGGDISGGGQQSIAVHANGTVFYTDVDGGSGLTATPATTFTPQNAWVHYAMQVSETNFALWINGTRKLTGNLGVWPGNGHNYAQVIPRTYFAYGTKSSTSSIVSPNCIYDSVRTSYGDIYGRDNTTITVPNLFPSEIATRSIYFVNTVYNANVLNAMFINEPTELTNPATKRYVDDAINGIPVGTDTYVTSGSVTGDTLRLTNNNLTYVDINVSSLNEPTFDQSLNTTDTVRFAEVIAPYGDFPVLNVNTAISLGTVNGTPGQVIITKPDGITAWSSVKTVNGESLIGSGNINIAQATDKYVVSGTVFGSTLTLTNNDASTVNINVGALLDDTTNTVSTGVLNGNVITFTRQDNTTFQVDVSALYDDTNLVTSVNGQTGSVTITDTNDYVDGVSLSGDVLTLSRTGSLPDLTVNLSSLRTVDTDNYVDSASLSGTILTLGRSGALPDLTVDLSTLSGSGVSNVNVFSRRETQDFTATAGQTIFSTSLGLFDVEVFYNGFKLDGEDYTISNGVITLLEAAQAGDNIEVIDYGSQDLTGETFISGSFEPSTPSLGTVWQDTRTPEPIIKIWNGTQWVLIGNVDTAYNKRVFEVTTPTSAFNAGYTIGLVEVFLNGLKLADTEYNALDGVTVNLVQPAQTGDHLEIIALTPLTSNLFYSKSEVDVLISNIDLTNYYTKAEVDQMIAGAGTGSSTTSGVTAQVVDSFSTTAYRSGEYLLMVTGTSGFMTLKMMVLFNGTIALNSQYGQLGTDLGTFDTSVVGDTVQIMFTPIDSTSVVQFSRTLIENLSAPAPSLPNDLNTGSGTLDLNSGSGTIDLNGTNIAGDLNSGSGTLDLNSGTGTSDLNQ